MTIILLVQFERNVITHMYVNERECVISLREQKESLRIWLNILSVLQWIVFEYTNSR